MKFCKTNLFYKNFQETTFKQTVQLIKFPFAKFN